MLASCRSAGGGTAAVVGEATPSNAPLARCWSASECRRSLRCKATSRSRRWSGSCLASSPRSNGTNRSTGRWPSPGGACATGPIAGCRFSLCGSAPGDYGRSPGSPTRPGSNSGRPSSTASGTANRRRSSVPACTSRSLGRVVRSPTAGRPTLATPSQPKTSAISASRPVPGGQPEGPVPAEVVLQVPA